MDDDGWTLEDEAENQAQNIYWNQECDWKEELKKYYL